MKPVQPIRRSCLGVGRARVLWRGAACAIAGWCLAVMPADLAAQQNAVTIQLPTYSSFSVSTTVLVPDRGGAALGGVNRSAMGGSQFGPAPLPAGTRAIGVERQAQNAHVFVQVHDFREMEEALVADGAGPHDAAAFDDRVSDVGRLTVMRPAAAPGATTTRRAANNGQPSGNPWAAPTSGDAAGQLSVEEWQRLRAQQAAGDQREARQWMERAAAAAESGNRAAARVYLNMAYRKADGALRSQIAAEMERLASPTATRPQR